MAVVQTFSSPAELQNYVNSILLPAQYWIVDKGGKYTVIQEDFTVTTLDSEEALEDFIDGLVDIKVVVPKRAGGMFTFISPTDPSPQANAWGLTVTSSVQEFEETINAMIDGGLTVELVVEHNAKKLIFSSPFDPDALEVFRRLGVDDFRQQVAINTFIESEKAAGNWGLTDHYFTPQLSLASWTEDGFQLGDSAGVYYGPALTDLTNYGLEDNQVSVGVRGYVQQTRIGAILSARNGNTIRTEMLVRGDQGPDLVGSANNGGLSGSRSVSVNGDAMWTTLRTGGGFSSNLIKNGTEILEGSSLVDVPTSPIAFGARFDGIHRLDAKIDFMSIGAGVGFDIAAHYTNYTQLMTDLNG